MILIYGFRSIFFAFSRLRNDLYCVEWGVKLYSLTAAWCCISARRSMDHRRAVDEERVTMLETILKETTEAATESERKYEEVCYCQKVDLQLLNELI